MLKDNLRRIGGVETLLYNSQAEEQFHQFLNNIFKLDAKLRAVFDQECVTRDSIYRSQWRRLWGLLGTIFWCTI